MKLSLLSTHSLERSTTRPKIISLIACYHAVIGLDCALVTLLDLFSVKPGHYINVVTSIALLALGWLPLPLSRALFLLMWMLLSLLASLGLWTLKPWGRIISITLAVTWILAAIAYFVMGVAFPQSYSFQLDSTVRNAAKLVMGTLILTSMFLPRVKVVFRQDRAPA